MKQRYHLTENQRTQALIGVALVVIVTYLIIKLSSPPSVETSMQNVADNINKTCPVMVDEFTQLDSVDLLKGSRTMLYYYTISDFELENKDINTVKQSLKEVLIDNINKAPEMKVMRENDVVFDYIYSNKERQKLIELTILPADYK